MNVISGRNAFLRALEKSKLLDPKRTDELRRESAATDSPQLLAHRLVREGRLTHWQSQQLMSGATKFYIGKYKLLRAIASGGMGVVYQAENSGMKREVALKVMSLRLLKNERAVTRFLREIRLAAMLDHPHCIRALDADFADGQYFLVTEHVRGRNPIEWAKRFPNGVPFAQSCECIRQAALGLHHAHERGLIHRDVKPGNLLVSTRSDGRPHVKVLDFGLSRLADLFEQDSSITRAGHSLGTMDYMAPEQAESAHEVDVRADVYGLGCTLFAMLTGRVPFPAKSQIQAMAAKLTYEAQHVRSLAPWIPDDLDAVVAKMLRRNPDERYETAQAVADALAPFASVL